jgi:AhpD family alkylhydroperoxidase
MSKLFNKVFERQVMLSFLIRDNIMTTRLNYFSTAPQAMDILLSQENYLTEAFKDNKFILALVKIRVSQINQCAFCLDMHNKEAIKLGESMERLYGLAAWRDMPFYSALEHHAFSWAELLTEGTAVSDEVYQNILAAFGEQGLVNLTLAVNAINSWNRIGKVFKPEIGCLDAN